MKLKIKFFYLKFLGLFKPSEYNFLKIFFSDKKYKNIVQIGANDGVQNDPLVKYLANKGNYKAILVEPIIYYSDKLKKLYKERSDIEIKEVACGKENDEMELFYIPPNVADLMNGNGPPNNWAHGQGSFSKESIIYWIEKNRFRGAEYNSLIEYFKNSIISKNVKIKKTAEVLHDGINDLIIIDVQGFELEVLKGLELVINPHKFIIIEVDHYNNVYAYDFLKRQGYKWIAGRTNMVFQNN